MAKKVLTMIKLQIPGGQANPAPPVGPALGQHGVNIMEFCKAFNVQTAQENGRIIPVEITVYEDPASSRPDQGGAAAREGIGRAEPEQGRPPDTCAGALDRRDEARRPERPRRRPGDEGDRRDCPLDGRGGGESVTQHGKRYRQIRGVIDREAVYSPAQAVRILKEAEGAK